MKKVLITSTFLLIFAAIGIAQNARIGSDITVGSTTTTASSTLTPINIGTTSVAALPDQTAFLQDRLVFVTSLRDALVAEAAAEANLTIRAELQADIDRANAKIVWINERL